MLFVLLLVFIPPHINGSPLIRLETRDPSQQARTQAEEQTQNTQEHAVIAEIFNPTETPIVNKHAPDMVPVPVATMNSQENHISSVMLEADFKIEAERRPVEINAEKIMKELKVETKEDKPPIALSAPCQSISDEDDGLPDSSDEVKEGVKPQMRIIPDCTQFEERFKETEKEVQGVNTVPEKIMETVMDIAKIQVEASPSTAPNQSDLGKKHIDVTLNELDQPAQVSLKNGFSVVEEEELPPVPAEPFDERKDLQEINDLEEDFAAELDSADCLDKAKMSKFLPPPAVNPPPRRLQMESEEDEKEKDIERKEQEFVFRVVVYFLSLLGDFVEDRPSTWQKIIAGVQCVLRDCREALPLRPTERPLIGEGSFIIRRARESLCTCYIPGITDVE